MAYNIIRDHKLSYIKKKFHIFKIYTFTKIGKKQIKFADYFINNINNTILIVTQRKRKNYTLIVTVNAIFFVPNSLFCKIS